MFLLPVDCLPSSHFAMIKWTRARHPIVPVMRPTWNTLSNETKRDDSIELSRFFVFGDI